MALVKPLHSGDPDVMMSVRHLVNTMQPNTLDAYEQLKARLTESYKKTKWQQVNTLLDMPPLGDRRPSCGGSGI